MDMCPHSYSGPLRKIGIAFATAEQEWALEQQVKGLMASAMVRVQTGKDIGCNSHVQRTGEVLSGSLLPT